MCICTGPCTPRGFTLDREAAPMSVMLVLDRVRSGTSSLKSSELFSYRRCFCPPIHWWEARSGSRDRMLAALPWPRSFSHVTTEAGEFCTSLYWYHIDIWLKPRMVVYWLCLTPFLFSCLSHNSVPYPLALPSHMGNTEIPTWHPFCFAGLFLSPLVCFIQKWLVYGQDS